jgi:rfaE bifunctional protein nucleotidyltransferase chain/domain
VGEIVLDHQELARRVETLKKAGKRVVFTNGGFDLIHVGHVRTLKGAKDHGDVLLVALNSDASVRRNKGAGLPIVPEAERAEMVASLACVDLVTVFDDPTVDRLLLLFKPNVHAKGTDYTKETVPERGTVASYGGEIAITGDPKAHSTSWLIARIRGEKK